MKKLTLFMAAAMLGLSANAATVYFDNTGSGWDKVYAYSWSPDVNKELTASDVDGHTLYAVTLTNEKVIFRASNTSWGDAIQTGDLAVVDGAVYDKSCIKSNGGNTSPVAKIVDGKWVTQEADKSLYLRGGMNSWGTGDSWKLSTADNVSYTWSGTIAANTEFKIGAASWNDASWGPEAATNVTANQTLTLKNSTASKNMKATEAITSLTFNTTTGVITFGEGGENPPTPPTPPVDPETDYTKWYLNVQGDYNSWKPSGVAFNAEGVATAEDQAIGASEFEIKIWNGTADAFYGNGQAIEADKEYVLTSGGGHMTITGAAAGDKYNVTYNAVTNTMKVVKVGGGDVPEPPTPGEGVFTVGKDYYIDASACTWFFNASAVIKVNDGITDVTCTKLEDGVLKFTPTAAGKVGEVKINRTNPTDGKVWNTYTITTAAGEHNMFKINSNFNGGTWADYTENGDNPEPPTPETDYTKWYLNVQGDYNSWTPSGVKFSAEGVATAENQAIGAGEFEIKIWNGSDDAYYGNGQAIDVDTEYVLPSGGGHMTITGAAEGDKFNVTFNAVTNTMKVTKATGNDPEPPTPFDNYDEWYVNVIGPFNDWKDNGVQPVGGVATLKDLNISTSEFKVKIYNGAEDVYYSTGGAIIQGVPTVIDGNTTANMTVEGANVGDNFTVVWNCKDNTILITRTSGVETIEAVEEGVAVYFNLQGVRVDNPANGVFVRVLNGKATKVVK